MKKPLHEINPADMSVEEIDNTIAELRRLQRLSAPVKIRRKTFWDFTVDMYDNIADIGNMSFSRFSTPRMSKSISEDWEQDTANLRGDMERISRDMWIGILQHSKNNR